MSRQIYTICLKDGHKRSFLLDVGRRKSLKMLFDESGLVVRAPYGCTNRDINDFILSNSDWIIEHEKKQQNHIGLPKSYENGEKIRLLGEVYGINFIHSDKFFPPYLSGNKLNAAVNELSDEKYRAVQIDKFISELALKTIKECFEQALHLVGKAPQKLTVKTMSSRWGSCTSKGNIAINSKVVQFSRECIMYVCIHELCHLEHMDHSKDFWAMVEKYCPDWKRIRKIMNN